VPEQGEAGRTIWQVVDEMLSINARHDHSYTRDELVELMDAVWPFAAGEKSFDVKEAGAEFDVFLNTCTAKKGKVTE
jgi:hypothetical protein